MKTTQISFWDQTQLALLRFMSILLGRVDRILNVRWGEKMLAHMAERWEARLKKLDREILALEKERYRSQSQAEALVIHAATIYLAGRMLAHDELRFDPAIPRDEEILDATIDMMVKQRLASISSVEIEPGHFVYDLEPDWPAIYGRISEVAEDAEPEFAEWLQESLRLIRETLLTQPVTHQQQPLANQYQE